MKLPNPIRWVKLQNRREERRRRNDRRGIRHAIAVTEWAIEELDHRRWNTPRAAEWVAMTRQIWRWRALLDRLKVQLEVSEIAPHLQAWRPRPGELAVPGGVAHPLGQQQEGN